MRPDDFDGFWLPILLAAIAFGACMLIAENLPWLHAILWSLLPP